MGKTWGSVSGQATLAALIAATILTTNIYITTNYIVRYKEQAVKMEQDLEYRLALQSTLDFILFGVKQKYCFDSVLMQDANCDLNHTASVARIVMSTDQESYVKELINTGKLKGITDPINIHLDKIEKKVMLNSVSTDHPLYVIYNNEKLNNLAAGVQVSIQRDNNLYLPRYSDEVYLNITVDLIGKNNSVPLVIGTKKMKLTSIISVHPRELGSFALLVPKDLHLDKTFNTPADQGDQNFHNFSSKQVGAGLIFQSPVFVNQNIYLPTITGSYTPVTFADRVYIGNGVVYKGSKPYQPATSGGLNDRVWTQQGSFGGFLNGIEVDGGLDQGLLYFGKVANAAPVDSSYMKACIYRTQSLINNDILKMNYISTTQKSYKQDFDYAKSTYRMTLSNGDAFTPQKNAGLVSSNSTTWFKNNGSFTRTTKSAKDGSPIGTITFSFINSVGKAELLTADVAYTSGNSPESISFSPPNDGLKAFIANNSTMLSNLNADLKKETSYLAELTVAENKLNSFKINLKNLESQLASEQAKKVQDAGLIGKLNSDIASAKNEIDSINNKYPNLNISMTETKKKIAQLQDQIGNLTKLASSFQKSDAQIKIEVAEVFSKNGNKQDNKADVTIEFINPDLMIDASGNRYNFEINMQAFDYTYRNKKSIIVDQNNNPIPNSNLSGYLIFTANQNGELKFPTFLSSATYADVSTAKEDPVDYTDLDITCEKKRNTKSSQAFGTADFNTDFSKMTRQSWNFAGTNGSTSGMDPLINEFIFDGTNASTASNSSFQVRSIVGICRIKASATFVTGFLGCDQLIIEARSTPLRIIATIIAGNVSIDPSAYTSGITWSSIYNPQATTELRKMGILKPLAGGSAVTCSAPSINSQSPVWHPIPSLQEISNRENCNTISLRERAAPFRWTAVDPDCALVTGNSNTVCKHSLVNFLVFEHSREGDL